MSQPQPQDHHSNLNIEDSEDLIVTLGNENVQGNGNHVVSGTGNCGTQTTIQKQEIHHHSAQPSAERKRPRNEQILLDAVATEVTDRRNQLLHQAVFINLPKEHQRDRVRRPWDGDLKIGTGDNQPIPTGQSVFQIFQQEMIRGKLLILGQPGSGKTTTLLDLAQDLIERAQRDMDAPCRCCSTYRHGAVSRKRRERMIPPILLDRW
ncbi:MAG: hypothetical protein AAGB19_19045 [Cyanobacteria bacterium P01_F01_bin.3]